MRRTLRGVCTPVAFACFLALLTLHLFGQATSGIILGTVQDVTGAAVPNAKVTITDVGTNITHETTTNESGNYTQPQLTPGTYTVTVEVNGFKKFTQQNVAVNVSQSARVDANLQLGQASQEVTVSSAPPSLETDRAEVQTQLSAQQVSSLPVLNRNFTNLALLTPGSVINTYQHAPSENPQQSTLVNTNGQAFAGTNYQLDGMNNNDAVLGITMVNPPVDSIGQFTAITSNYDAEYHATGAVINVETKSGTNEFHGTGFEFLQNNIFQARDPFTQGLHDPGTPAPANRGIPPLRWNQFGGSIGGPIKKDKLFFFGDYQGTQRRIGASETLRLPTAAERAGNLSDLGTTIYNPATGNPDGSGRQPFANNQVPVAAPIQNLLNLIPLPNLNPGIAAANNYSASTVENYNTNQFDIRGDYYATEKLRFFGRYNYLKSNINAPGPLGLYGGPAFNSLGFSGLSNALNQNAVGAATYTVSPTLLADFRVGFSQYHVQVSAPDQTQQLANSIGIPGLNIAGRPDTNGLPQFQINGPGGISSSGGNNNVGIGYSCNCPLDERETVYDYTSNWNKVAGNHTIRFGGTYEHAGNLRLASDNHRAGVYTFNNSVTSNNGSSNAGGLGLASFLLGEPSQFQRFGTVSTNQEDRQERMFYFAQDTWRITPKLTLMLGVRWDTWFPDYSLNAGQGGRYDVSTNLIYIAGVGGNSKSGNAQTQWHNISPRIGIAYSPDSKTVIRTGYGRGYSQGTFGWTFNNIANTYPTFANQNITSTSPYSAVFPITTAPPAISYPAVPANGKLPLPDGISVAYTPANLKLPYVDQYNFTIEREIAPQLNLSVGYVGNVGRDLNGGFNLNAALPGPGSNANLRRPLYNAYGLTQSIFDKCDCTSSNYNSLQSQLTKRFSQSYSLVGSFTWQKAMDYAQLSGLPTNQYNARSDYGPADFDHEYVFTLAHTLELPFGPGKALMRNSSGVVRALVANWAFRGITSYSSGLPFSPSLSSQGNLNSPDQTSRPQQIGDPTAGISQNRNEWFNPAAYTVNPLYTFGNAGRNSLRGPNYFEADWSVSKAFTFRERVGIEFRWEVFNAFNRTNLALPNTTVDSSAAGLIQDIQLGPTNGMRNMQFGAHISF